MTDQQKLETWAIVEIMGHQRFAGYVSERAIGGASLLQVDVPECDGRAAFTKLIGVGSIYAITPCTEETARAAAQHYRTRAFHEYELPRLPAPVDQGRDAQEQEDHDGKGWIDATEEGDQDF